MPAPDIARRIAAIERLIARDPARRGIANLVQWGALEAGARLLLRAHESQAPPRVGIISGFYLPVPQVGETDGPPGAKAIGQALEGLGNQVFYLTDALNAPLFSGMGVEPTLYAPGLGKRLGLTHLISTERPGRARDGRYYTMAARDITAFTAPLDELFLEAPAQGVPTLAIGDGGNEIGMGNVLPLVTRDVKNGPVIACCVGCDVLIVAGVSNWGAYGLVGALSALHGRDLLPSAAQAQADIQATVRAGAADGHTFRHEPTVDGQPLADNLALLEEVRSLALG